MNVRPRGFTLVELLVAIGILAVLVGLIVPAVSRARDAAAKVKCANNLRQIGHALHSYHDSYHLFPPGLNGAGGDMPFLSWSARILPFLDQGDVWRVAQEDYAMRPLFWTPPRHRAESMVIPIYICPAGWPDIATVDEVHGAIAFRHYLGVSGQDQVSRDGILFLNSRIRIADIRDGTSHTLAVGERLPSEDLHFGWWYAGVGQAFDGSADSNLGVRERRTTFRAPTCDMGPWHFQSGSQSDMCSTFHFYSNHIAGGANFLFCDGSVRFLSYSADPIMPALATRAGGEHVAVPE